PRPLPTPPPAPAEEEGVTYVTTPGVKSLEIETPVVTGPLDAELVKKVIHANRGQPRYCYESQLSANPALEGHVTMEFEINASGTVTSSNVAESTMSNDALKSCLAGRFRTWVFPRPKGGQSVKVKVGLKFTASGR
ncbi:MAG: AgmX/PglI C-terminal domain-containing protein, partial [Archangium sp.]|nr:AgmX/PglI C-terminal domain-containing protein [Archangium sp.]